MMITVGSLMTPDTGFMTKTKPSCEEDHLCILRSLLILINVLESAPLEGFCSLPLSLVN